MAVDELSQGHAFMFLQMNLFTEGFNVQITRKLAISTIYVLCVDVSSNYSDAWTNYYTHHTKMDVSHYVYTDVSLDRCY